MKNKLMMMPGRAALALVLLVPAAACANPSDQVEGSKRDGTATAKGASLATFLSRNEKKWPASDTDGDGKISRAEFLATAKAGKADPGTRFAKLDANSDGTVDKWEIDEILSRRFKRPDGNGDGILSADERAVARDRMNNDAANALEP